MKKTYFFSLVAVFTLVLTGCSSNETSPRTDEVTPSEGSSHLYPAQLSFLDGAEAIPSDTAYVFTIQAANYEQMFTDWDNVFSSYVFDEVVSINEDTVTLKNNGDIPMGLVIPIPANGGDSVFTKSFGSFDNMVSLYKGVTLDYFQDDMGEAPEGQYIPLTGSMNPGESVSLGGDFATIGQCKGGRCWVIGFADSMEVYDESDIDSFTPVDPSTLQAGDTIQGVAVGSFIEMEVISVDGGLVTVQYPWAGEISQNEIYADQIML